MPRWIARLLGHRRPDPPGLTAAITALHEARDARRETEERAPIVEAAVAPLRQARQENNFAARYYAALQGGGRAWH